ncbi:MAG: arginine repressor [Eubacteriaceae bacterium]|jgi:transcriptional regulator of arginine metabolism|nr:arginine repressor [Eubacteriaceae bacterium]MDD4507421.1 arginine repressor [Eubacteriaceae bacterium]
MKVSRQSKILEIIENYQIETQEELASHLKVEGFHVTQATVSRDIKELKLIKVAGKGGRQCYASMKDMGTLYDERVATVFTESVLTVDTAAFLVVLHTLPAMAQAAALAIDGMEWREIVGTIAGDDTIFVAVRNEEDVVSIAERFRKLMK